MRNRAFSAIIAAAGITGLIIVGAPAATFVAQPASIATAQPVVTAAVVPPVAVSIIAVGPVVPSAPAEVSVPVVATTPPLPVPVVPVAPHHVGVAPQSDISTAQPVLRNCNPDCANGTGSPFEILYLADGSRPVHNAENQNEDPAYAARLTAELCVVKPWICRP